MRTSSRSVLLLLSLAAAFGSLTRVVDAQEPTTYTINGRVRDAETGSPLVGVQLLIRGTRNGALSDARGVFSIIGQLAAGSYVLEAQMIGRETATQAITLGGERVLNVSDIALATTALSLQEVVVTGTAAPTARRALGNAVSTVDGATLRQSPATTIDQALQGKVAGAFITSNTGTPGGGVSVRLRGTSSIVSGAEPLYIVDGVIVDNNGDQQVNFGYRSNPSNRLADLDPNDIERIEILKGAAAAALFGSRANNGVVQIFTKRGHAGGTQLTAASRFTLSNLERKIDFALTPVNETGAAVQRFDPQDLIFRDAWSNDSYVSLAGGNADTRYYISGNWVDQSGIMEGSNHRKLNARMNLDQRLGSWLDLSAGANFVNSHSDLVINGENGTGGLLTAIVFTPTTRDLAARDPQTGELINRLSGTFPNPLDVLANWKTPQDVNRFVGSLQLKANPLNTLRLEYRLGFDRYEMETGQSIPRGDATFPLGSAFSANRRNMLINNDVAGSYEFGTGNLLLTSAAGVNHTYQRVDQFNLGASDLTPLTELVRGAVQTASEGQVEAITTGFYGQQQVAWNNRLFLTGALRWDASSTFGEAERWQLYPKVSGSWVVSEEPFFQSAGFGWLSELRLRGALGYAGNQPPLDNAYARAPRYATSINIDRLGLVPLAQVGNPDLKPERQREWEAGFDVSFLDKRIGASFSYYDKYTKDLLLERPFVPSAGYGTILDNVGEMSNKGVELELSTVNFNSERFGWNSRLLFSRNENRVEKLLINPFTVGYTNRVVEGEEIGVHYMLAFQRDTATGEVLTDADGPLRTLGSIVLDKSPWPDFTASLANDFRFGAFDLSVLLDGSFGAYLWNQTRRIMDIFAAGPLYDQLLRDEITPAQRTRLQGIWEYYLEDASFVKLRDVTLRWSTSAEWLRAVGASRMQLELIGRNLYTWTDYTGYDPEINMFGLSTVARGTDFAVFPNPRTVGLGVRFTY
ncbi:MAG: TonB-dependent receptor domain-containing protein [Longimicrobiales bacterium]